MSWLTPLGFLGLIGLIILIIIYIIKPNYQQKIISSTFVWKLSLKYRKKKIPINHLRNLLIFLCQVLIITACAMILAQPFLPADEVEVFTEKVVIIDASASMRAEINGKTRFERAVAEVQDLVDEVIEKNGMITVIMAGKEASYLVQRAGADLEAEIRTCLDELVDPNDLKCTFGEADIEGAITLAEEITSDVPDVDVLLYTGNSYIDSGKIDVRNMGDIYTEKNAAILDARAIIDENYYRFEIDVAAYGIDNQVITVHCQVRGANYEKTQFDLSATINCPAGVKQTVVFEHEADEEQFNASVYSYESVYISIEEKDSFSHDNSFFIYGGTKQPIKIQYYSTNANNFFSGILMSMRNELRHRWDIDIEEVKPKPNQPITPASEGFDVYIFEDTMPLVMPKDGLVILVDPDPLNANLPFASGLIAQQVVTTGGMSIPLTKGESHPITNYMTVENITVTEYIRVQATDANFIPLMYCGADPVLFAKDTDDGQIVLLGFDLNFSNQAVLLEFPTLIYNLFEYYLPSTITDYAYEVDETVTLNSRGNYLTVSGPNMNEELKEFPAELPVTRPGTYSLMYTPISGSTIMEEFFVKIPASESNIFRSMDDIKNPEYAVKEDPEDFDLVFYFAIALVALLFIEWWLQSREHF